MLQLTRTPPCALSRIVSVLRSPLRHCRLQEKTSQLFSLTSCRGKRAGGGALPTEERPRNTGGVQGA